MNLQDQIKKLILSLSSAKRSDRVNIGKNALKIVSRSGFKTILLRFSDVNAFEEENKQTLEWFFQSFGKTRVLRILDRCKIGVDKVIKSGFKVGHIEKLFLNLAVITVEDLKNLLEEINEGSLLLPHLNSLKIRDVRKRLLGKKFNELSKEDLDNLYDIAVPFERIEDIFLFGMPQVSKMPTFFEISLKQVVLSIELFRRGRAFIKEKDLFEYYKLKSIIKHYLPDGMVIPEIDGYRSIYKKYRAYGINLAFLKPVAKTKTATYCSQILCLSTQKLDCPKFFQTWIEDFRSNQGARGVKESVEMVDKMLHQPHLGFVQSVDELVDISGCSLGGTQAQRFACIFFKKLRNITLICSPKIDVCSAAFFDTEISDRKEKKPIQLNIIINEDDRISALGDKYIGHGISHEVLDFNVKVLKGLKDNEKVLDHHFLEKEKCFLSEKNSLMNRYRILKSLFTSHSINILLCEKYHIYNYSNDNSQRDDLFSSFTSGVPHFERLRKIFGCEMEFISFIGKKNSDSYKKVG